MFRSLLYQKYVREFQVQDVLYLQFQGSGCRVEGSGLGVWGITRRRNRRKREKKKMKKGKHRNLVSAKFGLAKVGFGQIGLLRIGNSPLKTLRIL